MKKQIYLLALLAITLFGDLMQAQNLNVTLAGTLTYPGALSNITSYVDSQGNEYALVGAAGGMSVVNVNNPSAPTQVALITGPNCSWREIKVLNNHAYITTECGSIGLQIVDLSPLPNTTLPTTTWLPTINGDPMTTIHALHADAGRIYLYGSSVGNGGVVIADVSTTPMAPVYLGIYDFDYVHDGYVRNNKLYGGHIYAGEFSIMDVSNPANIPTNFPRTTTPGAFTHNTWLPTNNANYVFTTDEVSGSYLTCYDISNVNNITEVDRIQSQNPGSGSIVHNTHIVDVNGNDFAVTSWYKDGIVITDVGRPGNLVNVGWYDTYPQGSGGGFSGCWGVNPFLPSRTIVCSDINNGLIVLSPTYVRACYLEGTITDANTSLPINAATITISSLGINDASAGNGFYGTGCATAGSYSVTYSKPGYFPQTVTVALSNGVVTIQNIALVPMTPFVLSGQVIQSWNSAPVPNAHVKITNSNFTFDTITDVNGNFSFPSAYSGIYEVIGGKWLYKTKCTGNNTITSTSGPVTIALDSGIYDDFTFDYLWTETGTASTGNWEFGEPLGTTDQNPGDANPDFDVTPDCFVNAYVTGNTGVSSSDDDVDGGYTMLTSPVFDLTAYTNPKMQYSTWFFNAGGNGNPNDSMKVQINNGTTTVTLETITENSGPESVWTNKMFLLSSVIPITSTMKVMVRAVDYPFGNLVEAGFDHFRITDSLTNIGINENGIFSNQLVVYPNPVVPGSQVMYSLTGEFIGGNIHISDVTGKTLETIAVGNASGGIMFDASLPAGIYFVDLRDQHGNLLAAPLRIVKLK